MPLTVPSYRSRAQDPSDHGYLAWTSPIEILGGAVVNATGLLYGTRIQVPTTISVTNITVYVSTIGATLTAGQNLLGLYTSAGAKIAQTADQSAVWTSTGLKLAALTSGPFTIVGGPSAFIYAAFLSVGTTPAAFRGLNIPAPLLNAGQATGLGGTSVSQGAQTTIPATFAPTLTSALGQWAALS